MQLERYLHLYTEAARRLGNEGKRVWCHHPSHSLFIWQRERSEVLKAFAFLLKASKLHQCKDGRVTLCPL